jgi:hypothetical protein
LILIRNQLIQRKAIPFQCEESEGILSRRFSYADHRYGYLYLHSFGCGSELRQGLTEWIGFYNHERGHSALDDRTPDEVYYGRPHPFAEAA